MASRLSAFGALGQVSVLPAVAPFSASTRIFRFFSVESVTTSTGLGELGSVLRLFVGGLFPVQADLGIALPVGHTGHG